MAKKKRIQKQTHIMEHETGVPPFENPESGLSASDPLQTIPLQTMPLQTTPNTEPDCDTECANPVVVQLRKDLRQTQEQLRKVKADFDKLRIQESVQETNIREAALATEEACEQKVQRAESMAAHAKKELSEKQGDLAKAHVAVKKLVEQFNVLIDGIELAQGKGAFTLKESHKYWSSVLAVKSMFSE